MAQAIRSVIQFGPANRSMVGVYHAPRVSDPTRPAVLICNPFGQEAIRAHRVFIVLAERLADLGIPALRFDYFGTGDSSGDDVAGDLTGWTEDVVLADSKLRQLAHPPAVVWIGLRLGATLAAMASANAEAAATSLILWDPIVNGRQYLRELAIANHCAALQGFSTNAGLYRKLQREPIPEEATEALGFALSASLREQLRSVDAGHFTRMRTERCTIIASKTDKRRSALLNDMIESRTVAATYRNLSMPIEWATNDAGGRTIAPTEVIKLIVPAVLEASP